MNENQLKVISEELINSGQLIEYYRASNAFTDAELLIWDNIYKLDGVTYKTKDF